VRSDVDLTARGPLSKLTLAGDLLLTDSRFVKNIDVLGSLGGERPPPIEGKGGLFSFRDPPLRDLVFDLRIKTGEPFLVRNQYVRGTFRPDLTLTGTGEQPLLLGEVKIDPFRLNLPTGVLKTDPGTVAFLASDPDRPRIDVRGSTRLIGYDIIVKVEGFLDDMRVILSSLPALPDDELLLLLLTGTPPASGDQEASASAAGAAMAVFLGRSFFARYFGSEEGANEMIQDRFETFIGRDISEKGDMTIDSTFRLKEEVFRKGDTLYIVGEKDKYDDVNYGVRLIVEFQDDEETGK
jgi:translocation and assembly module TamB